VEDWSLSDFHCRIPSPIYILLTSELTTLAGFSTMSLSRQIHSLSKGSIRFTPRNNQVLAYPKAKKQFYRTDKSSVLQISEEVQDAHQTGKPVVALETTIYTHGTFHR